MKQKQSTFEIQYHNGRPYIEYWVYDKRRKRKSRFRSYRYPKTCPICGKEFFIQRCQLLSKRNFCSRKCQGQGNKGKSNPNWRNGIFIDRQGYKHIRIEGGHPQEDIRGYVLEHRYAMEKKLGRPLESWEVVHHINNDKTDSSPENLEIYPNTHHNESVKKMHDEIRRLQCLLKQHNIVY